MFSHAVNGEAEQSLVCFQYNAALNGHPALHLETEVKAMSSARLLKSGEVGYSSSLLVGRFVVSRWP